MTETLTDTTTETTTDTETTTETQTTTVTTTESSGTGGGNCDPNYEGACLDPNAPDYDCEGGSGDGPKYTGRVTVVGDDHFGLDRDGNGVGCES